MNSLKKRIIDGEVVLGIFYKLNTPVATEIIGWAGVDFIVVDCEHSAIGYENVENIVRAGKASGVSTIIRVPCASEEHIFHALDSGADGVQIPNLTSVAQFEESSRSAKYYPLGVRGLSRQTRAAKYGMQNDPELSYTDWANANTLVSVHIENKEMAQQIEEICKIPQIDVLFIGPADMSQSYGIPGKTSDPRVVDTAMRVIKAANEAGKCAGINVTNMEDAKMYIDAGARYILYSSDTAILSKGLRKLVSDFAPFKEQ